MENDQGTGADAAFNFQLYPYTPSLPAAIVIVAVLAMLTAFHTWRLLRARAYYFRSSTSRHSRLVVPFKQLGKKAVEVEYGTKACATRKVAKARKEVILSADALQIPQIL
ncbi:hypothetical protein BFJ68_g17182 [Fusarium oxysporum]|uniref:Uncharacterized protein n=1 Tax=Fusarium oxysporum TaxID=5507 RepID=A0A420MBB1_FUSOX|nr:hypothetical protein BFJ66_g17750 [Fusarium oxysporum f. sp. cepae]RKK65328.1 hypothetical protein BFJ69_g16386 [Fusarium oxysporum]RKK85987.1 hypothetical protein BFJ68_g17182 [Fusarium oxysporum]